MAHVDENVKTKNLKKMKVSKNKINIWSRNMMDIFISTRFR